MNTPISETIENCTASIMLSILNAGLLPPQKNDIQEILREEVSSIYAIAAAEEREACARVCEETPLNHPGRADMTAIQLAATIRARGQDNEKTV